MKIQKLPLLCVAVLLGGCGSVSVGPDVPDTSFQARMQCQQSMAVANAPVGNRDIAMRNCVDSQRAAMEAYGQSDDDTFTLPSKDDASSSGDR